MSDIIDVGQENDKQEMNKNIFYTIGDCLCEITEDEFMRRRNVVKEEEIKEKE